MKKLLIPIGILVILLAGIMTIRHPFTDRFNPLIKEMVSYGKVPKKSQDYKDVVIYDEKGKKIEYTLDFNGYQPDHEIVKINHKGKHVIVIEYIDGSPQVKKLKEAGALSD